MQRIARLLRRPEFRASSQSSSEPKLISSDGLDAFAQESRPMRAKVAPIKRPTAPARSRRVIALAAGSAGVLLLALLVYFVGLPNWIRSRGAEPPIGTLMLDTSPAAVEVVVDGRLIGVTPVTLSVPAGSHTVVLRRGASERTLNVTVGAGSQIAHHVEFATTPMSATSVGRLIVTTDPPGARVSVDELPRGVAPLTLHDLAPGEHTVSITSDAGTAQRKVIVEPAITASVVFTLSKAGPGAGWLALTAPFDVQILENGDLVGTGVSSKVMLPAGKHQVRLVNDALGYEEARTIDITTGKITSIKVDPPKSTMSANARPWADVIIDGDNVGQTPLANISIAIGRHRVVFRHPELGEQRQDVTITVKGPNRISADLTKR